MRKIIRTDGAVEEIDGPLSMDMIHKLIGADTVDSVVLHHLGEPRRVMIVDDNGWEYRVVKHPGNHIEHVPIRARKPVNDAATRLYWANCRVNTTHQIVGDVVVCPDADFGEGP